MAIPLSLKKAQEQYIKRNEAKDLVRVSVWVPALNADELKLIAHDMREEYINQLKEEGTTE